MIAIGEAYAECSPGARIIALGQSGGLEASLLPERGFAFHGIDAAPVFGAATPAGLAAAVRALWRGFWQARRILADAGAEIVVGVGGYVTAAPLLAARSLGLATLIFEANVIPGRANRLLRRFADAVCVGQAETRSYGGWENARVTGHPIRKEIVALAPRKPVHTGDLHVLVTGGSLGSAFLDRVCPSLCASLTAERSKVSVLHQSCPTRVSAVTRAYADQRVEAEVRPFLDMRGAYAWADVALCAAGAGTLAEIETIGLPALAVPIENVADGHQAANADAFSTRSALPSLREGEWQEGEAAKRVMQLVSRDPLRGDGGAQLHAQAAPSIVAICEALLEMRQSGRAGASPMAHQARSAKS
jgi:UDP-N-acetylglucosamine--N-acetylmuramyl-(pentapeptide) pyrophosphoryl-undecaprenol N-acetylglucosamine transferase